MSSANTSPQFMACSSQERPWSPRSIPTISTTTPEGCVGGGGSWGGGFFFTSAAFLNTLLGLLATATEAGMGNAGRFARTVAPHIWHSTAAHVFSARKVQVLHCQRLLEKDAMVRVVCAAGQHLVVFSHSLTQAHLKKVQQTAYWGSPESSQ